MSPLTTSSTAAILNLKKLKILDLDVNTAHDKQSVEYHPLKNAYGIPEIDTVHHES
jgi:hypothetical protein